MKRSISSMAWLALLCGIALWGSAAGIGRAADDEDVPTHSSRSGASRTSASRSADATRASETGREAKIEAKLDQILANQDQVLAKLDEVMEELKIVKIRATIR